jgi:hypothetical protein
MEDVKPAVPSTEEKPPVPQVNDITAPLPGPPAPETAPKDEVQQAPALSDDEAKPSTEPAHGNVADKPKAKAPKQHGSGFAIFAAIVIVLGLGAMFTYAYLQTQ